MPVVTFSFPALNFLSPNIQFLFMVQYIKQSQQHKTIYNIFSNSFHISATKTWLQKLTQGKQVIQMVSGIFNVVVYNYIIQIQMRMEIEIKHGDSGHSEIIHMEEGARGQNILNHISNEYKISPKDQLLFTKIGHIIEPHEAISKYFSNQAVDKTISSDFNNNNNNHIRRIFCLFLFNLKELNKPNDICQSKPKAYWVEQLKDKLINLNNQSSTIFPYDSHSLKQSYSQEQLQKYEKFVQKINSLKESYKQLSKEYSNMKAYSYNIEQTVQKCSNQQKSINTLLKSIKSQSSVLKQKLKELFNLKQALKAKFATDDKSLRENSGFFESKKKYENSVTLYESQIVNLKQHFEPLLLKFKEDYEKHKAALRNSNSKTLQFGKKTHITRLEESHKLNQKNYDEILSLFNQLVQSNTSCQSKYGIALQVKIQRSSQNIAKVLVDQFANICEDLTNYYCQFSQFTEDNKLQVKHILKWYVKIRNQMGSYFKTAVTIENAIKSEIEQQNKRRISVTNKNLSSSRRQISQSQLLAQTSNFEQTQIKRRIRFKKVLNSFQSFASKMCLQEQNLRKKFVSDLNNNQKCEYECLKNAKVPQIDFQQNGSSDLQLMRALQSSNIYEIQQTSLSPQEFMIYSYNVVLEKIKATSVNDTNNKVKNLQQILKRLGDVFSKVYNKKINELMREKEQINLKIPQLQQKIASMQSDLQNSKYQIIDLSRKISEKQDKLIIREKQRSEQVNKQRLKYEKLLADYKSLEKTLSKQTKVNQELYNQILRSEDELKDSLQLNQYLKELLAQKQIQIIQIEKKAEQKQKQLKQTPKIIQNDLKSAVLSNFSKDLNAVTQKNTEKDGQIERLNQEIAMLQRQNEELQEEYEQLSNQMRKIITKQTEDIEVQVNSQEPAAKQLPHDGITIAQQITVGQDAIFMPFTNSVYVGIAHKDDDRTICNINNIHFTNYLLDLNSFNLKTTELLSQCSFLIVLRVTSVYKQGNRMMVKGQIKHIFGFQDDNIAIKDYATLVPC